MKNLSSKKSGYSIHQDAEEWQGKRQVVFVHGWGMNSAVWQPLLDALPSNLDPVCIDLPGHGEFSNLTFRTLDDLTEHLEQRAEQLLSAPALWVGWSLGGLPVLKMAAKQSAWVDGVIAIASNPCFVNRDGWSMGVEAEVFNLFASNLEQNIEKTLQRFLSLQVQGVENARDLLRVLRAAIVSRGLPSAAALNAGLNVLKATDLRDEMANLRVPVQWLLGEKDTLVPASLNEFLRQQGLDSRIIGSSAHLPFVSHTADVKQALLKFR